MIVTELSADSRAIADLLATTPVGATATFAEMSGLIGRDVRRHRHVVSSGRRCAQREHGAVFVVIRGTGYRRLPAEEVATVIGSTARRHIRRTAGRATRTLVAGTRLANDLPAPLQRRLAAELSTMALLEHLSRDAVTKPTLDAPLKPTPVAVTARLFLAQLQGGSAADPG